MGVALLVAVVQVVAWRLDRRRIRYLPQALGATGAAFLAGAWIALAAEFRWVDPKWLDAAAPWIVAAMLGWMFLNRLGWGWNPLDPLPPAGEGDAQGAGSRPEPPP